MNLSFFRRFANNSPPPGVHPQTPHYPNPNSGGGGGNGANVTGVNSGSAPAATTGENAAAEFNPTAAYLWLLSQQQQHLPNAAAAAAALNLSSRTMAASSFLNGGSPLSNGPNGASLPMANPTNGMPDSAKEKERSKSNEEHKSNGVASNGQTQNLMSTIKKHRDLDDDDDDTSTDDDDVESTNSNSNHSENPVSSSGFNGINSVDCSNWNVLTNTLFFAQGAIRIFWTVDATVRVRLPMVVKQPLEQPEVAAVDNRNTVWKPCCETSKAYWRLPHITPVSSKLSFNCKKVSEATRRILSLGFSLA